MVLMLKILINAHAQNVENMKIYPKAFIIPCYILWLVGIIWIGNQFNKLPPEEIGGLPEGFTIFIFFTCWMPAIVGFWLHNKLCPNWYKNKYDG
jgi:hypothetical protein